MTKVYNSKLLKNKKIGNFIIDQLNVRLKHPELFKKMFDLTEHHLIKHNCVLSNNTIAFFHNFDIAMKNSNDFNYIVLHSVGNLLVDNEFYEHLENYINKNPDFFIIGFTLDWWKEDTWVELHNQMIVVNVRRWNELGRPLYGEWGDEIEDLPNYIRSSENFHDHYTPHWMQGTKGTSKKRRTKQGYNIIKVAFENQIKIDNFTEEMRNCRTFLYPESFSDNFYKCITKELSYVDAELNPNQRKWLKLMDLPPQLWVYNSEKYNFVDITFPRNVKKYIGPASGLKFLDIFNYTTDDIEFVIYDYSNLSLDWIKNLRDNWDGKNFLEFLDNDINEYFKPFYKFINGSKEDNQKILIEGFGSVEIIEKLFKKFKQSKVTFVKSNLFDKDDVDILLQEADNNTFINYSNIFSTDLLLRHYTKEFIEQSYQYFTNKMMEKTPVYNTYGCDTKGRWNEIKKY